MYKSFSMIIGIFFIQFFLHAQEDSQKAMMYFELEDITVSGQVWHELSLKYDDSECKKVYYCAGIFYQYLSEKHVMIHSVFIALESIAESMIKLLLLQMLKMDENLEKISFRFSSNLKFSTNELLVQKLLLDLGFEQMGEVFESGKMTKCLLCQVLYGDDFWEQEALGDQEEEDLVKNIA